MLRARCSGGGHRLLYSFLGLLFLTGGAALSVNQTVDDASGDLKYSGGWNNGPDCTTCFVNPANGQKSLMYAETWHDTTAGGGADVRNVSYTFTGTAGYIFCVLVDAHIPDATTNTFLSFTLDGADAGTFSHVSTGAADVNGGYVYNVSVWQKESLANTQHTLVMSISSQSGPSIVLFDYLVYTQEHSDPTSAISGPSGSPSVSYATVSKSTSSSSTSSSTPTSSPTPTPKPSTPIGPIVGGVVGGILVLALVLLGLFLLRRRRNRPRESRSNVLDDEAKPDEGGPEVNTALLASGDRRRDNHYSPFAISRPSVTASGPRGSSEYNVPGLPVPATPGGRSNLSLATPATGYHVTNPDARTLNSSSSEAAGQSASGRGARSNVLSPTTSSAGFHVVNDDARTVTSGSSEIDGSSTSGRGYTGPARRAAPTDKAAQVEIERLRQEVENLRSRIPSDRAAWGDENMSAPPAYEPQRS